MKEVAAIAALIVSIGANVPYVFEIIKGKAQPERISWLLWSVLGSVYFVSAVLDDGAVAFTAGELFGPALIFLLALKYGVGGTLRRDKVSLVIAGIALVALVITNNVLFSLLIALFIDSIGAFLTVRKVQEDPTSESRAFWAMGAVSGLLGLLSLNDYSFTTYAFPAYVVIVSGFMFAITENNK